MKLKILCAGEVLASWGEELFFMPHMITVDQMGHIWLTDVGLHQVFKYDARGKLLLTLGKRLEPGSGTGNLFCKPTQASPKASRQRLILKELR